MNSSREKEKNLKYIIKNDFVICKTNWIAINKLSRFSSYLISNGKIRGIKDGRINGWMIIWAIFLISLFISFIFLNHVSSHKPYKLNPKLRHI